MSTNQALINATYIVPKISGALSIAGSLLIICDVTRRYCKAGGDQAMIAPRHRLLVGMSLCDVCSSTAHFVWTWAVPSNDYVKWSYGTWGTCQAQGFFTQIFVGTMMYNSSLAFCYFLSIYKGLSDRNIATQYELYLHAIPILLAVGTASAALGQGLINPSAFQCWIISTPHGCKESWENGGATTCERGDNAGFYRLFYFFVPCVFSMIFITVVMITIYCRIRAVEKAASRFRLSERRQFENSRKFALQALLYVGAFYVTWFFTILSRILSVFIEWGDFSFVILVLGGCLMPLQGFLNAIVYCIPRWRNNRRESLLSNRRMSAVNMAATRLPAELLDCDADRGGLESSKDSNVAQQEDTTSQPLELREQSL